MYASPTAARSAIAPADVLPSDPPKIQTILLSASATDRLGSRHVGQLGMTGRKDTARNREVNRVDRRCEHLDRVSGRLGNVVHLRERADVAYHRCLHGQRTVPVAHRPLAGAEEPDPALGRRDCRCIFVITPRR
jgi:hypothetical protein